MDTNIILTEDIAISQKKEVAGDATVNFCTIWPNAKTALELLSDLVGSKFIKVIISSVVAAGDSVSKKVCD